MNSNWKLFYVPWADISEWNTVRSQIFSKDPSETMKAYWTIFMWKLRFDSIPAYIECTFGLLQVMLKEHEIIKKAKTSIFDEHDLQLYYSTALIRFVNHICSISIYKKDSLYLAATTQKIPDWIVNMRHDAAHGQNLPTLEALHLATEIALKWLLDNYWMNKTNFAFEKSLNDSLDVENTIKAQNFLRKAFELWEYIQEYKKANLLLIKEMERELILLVEELLNLRVLYYSDFKCMEIKFLKNLVREFSQQKEKNVSLRGTFKCLKMSFLRFLKKITKFNHFIENTFIASLFESTFLSDINFEPRKWQKILHLIQEIGLFSYFIQELFQFAGEGHKGASEWLTVLLPSLKQLRREWTSYKAFRRENKNFKKKLFKQRALKFYDVPDLVIKLDLFQPPTLSLDIMNQILLNPENLSTKVIIQYLKLIKPTLLESTIELIQDLLSLLYKKKENLKELKIINERIFTVEDIENFIQNNKKDPVYESFTNEEKGWLKSSIDVHVWSKCALGLLPFQSKVDCNLPHTFTWKGKPMRKTNLTPLMKHNVNMKKMHEELV